MTTVAMDVRVLMQQSKPTGIAQYIACILAEYLKDKGEIELSGLSHINSLTSSFKVPLTVIPPKKGLPWQSLVLPWYLRAHHYDVFHGPAFSLPPWGFTPKIVTIHDTVFYRMPEFVRADTLVYLRRMLPRSLREAKRIIVPSKQVQDDVLKLAPWLSVAHIAVISLGADRLKDRVFDPHSPKMWDVPYLLHVGTIEPRKNLEFLLQVFARLLEMTKGPYHLVLAGANGWNNESFWRSYEQFALKDRVHILGYVSDEDTVKLYQGAWVYLSPSHYEGFGLGSFEALWQGCPVISSPTGGVNDYRIGGLNVLPTQEKDSAERWAAKILEIITHPDPIERTLLPTWANTYRQHASLYHEVAHGGR